MELYARYGGDWPRDDVSPQLVAAGVAKGQRAFFLVIGGRLVAGQSSPHRHEAEGGDVTKGQRAFFLIIGVGM